MNSLPTSRPALPKADEITFKEAVLWLAFGAIPGDDVWRKNLEEQFEIAERFIAHVFDNQPHLGLGKITSHPLIEGVFEIWPLRHQLTGDGWAVLRETLRRLKQQRIWDQNLDLAERLLIEAAKSGQVLLRAKESKDDTLPIALDAAYFRNPVYYSWCTDEFSLDTNQKKGWEAYFQLALDQTLSRYVPLVNVRSLQKAFPTKQDSNGHILRAGRTHLRKMQKDGVLRAYKEKLRTLLEEQLQETIGRKRWDRVYDILKLEFPGMFRVGAPKKE